MSGEAATETDVDVLVVGAGVTGIYQLYRALRDGFSAELVEAGSGVGGTWYWNKYPGARFDSESYTYAYLFDKDLFDEWVWEEEFAPQTETERYFNHVVDRYDLRRHIDFDTRVTSAVWDDASGSWVVTTDDGVERRARYLVSATGVLSVPFYPEVPGREDYAGVSVHTGLWPAEGVDLAGKRVAVIGTGSSGVQILPVIADEVGSVTVYQRSANWCTPLNNRLITDAEQAKLRAEFEPMCEVLNTSMHGFLHEASNRNGADETPEQRAEFFESIWNSPGFSKLTTNYMDLLFDEKINAEWCEFIAAKVRSIVADPVTAERLIPKDHKFGEKRPPFVAGYYEAYNKPNVSLVSLRETPIVRITETGIETEAGEEPYDVIIWATGFDFGTGALNRMGIVGRDGLALTEHWADGPTTFLGVQTEGFPNFFFPGGPHAAAGNNPRYNGDQVDFIADTFVWLRDHDLSVIEASPEAEERWCAAIEKSISFQPFTEKSYYFGTNVPGKPTRFLLNSAGRPKLLKEVARVKSNDYEAFVTR